MIDVENTWADGTTGRRRSLAATAAKLLVLVSGLVLIVSIAALHYEYKSGANVTLWRVSQATATTLVVLGSVAVVFAGIGLFTKSTFAPAISVGIAAYLIGQFFPSGGRGFSSYEIGFGLAAGASIAMAVGGLFAVAVGVRRPRTPVAAENAQVVVGTPAGPSDSAATPATLAPAGWYPDPSKEASERFWTGDRWTAQTRS